MTNPSRSSEVKQLASQVLAGLLANPHIYPNWSDAGVQGQREQTMIVLAIEIAEDLIDKVDSKSS